VASPVLIGDRRFPSKKAAADAIRGILRSYAPRERVAEHHAAVLADLLDLHPEAEQKIGCGVAFFTVERNLGSCGFWLTRTDGTKTDWSFLACLTPPSKESEARAAFRTAIRSQIEAFRRGVATPFRCPITGDTVTAASLHVDHERPFEELLNVFLTESGTRLADVAVLPTVDGSTDTELADYDLRRRWEAFHEQHARLRAVSARANLSTLRRRKDK
jgi:hypothetical protein